MTKKKRPEITEREQKARERRKQEHAERRTQGEDAAANAAEAARLIQRLEELDAADVGLTLDQWRRLSVHEQIAREEEAQDRRYARDQRLTLDEYRAQRRRLIENGELRAEYGLPQWLRDQYAREKPVAVVAEYLDLVTRGATATGDELVKIYRAIDAHTGNGHIHERSPLPPFAEMRQRLLDELERASLLDLAEEFLTSGTAPRSDGGTQQ